MFLHEEDLISICQRSSHGTPTAQFSFCDDGYTALPAEMTEIVKGEGIT